MKKVTGIVSYTFDKTSVMTEQFKFIYKNDLSDAQIKDDIKNKNSTHHVFSKNGNSSYKVNYLISNIKEI